MPKRRPRRPDFRPRLIIYNAKGPANACGPGCDRWIAVEGQVDEGAAARVSRFLRDVKDSKRPIYFHSPGGSVRPSYVIARLLRGRKAVARIGRTIATGCAGGTQVDAACLKVKTQRVGRMSVPRALMPTRIIARCAASAQYLPAARTRP